MSTSSCVDVSIVIVQYETPELTKRCVESVLGTRGDCNYTFEILVVDNGSRTDEVASLTRRLPVTVIRLEQGRGLSRAWNIGVRHSRGRYILFLNSDVLLYDNAIAEMVDYLEDCPNAGVAGPKLFVDKQRQELQVTCNGLLTLETALWKYTVLEELFPESKVLREFRMSSWGRDTTREVDTVCGAAFMVRREIFDDVAFDEGYHFFLEEHDFARQIQLSGWETHYLADVSVIHLHGATMNRTSPVKKRLWGFHSLSRYLAKYYGWFPASVLLVVALLNLPLKRLLKMISTGGGDSDWMTA